jgi:hypothetical protein
MIRPRFLLLLDASLIALAGAMLLSLAVRSAESLHATGLWWLLPPSALAGLVCADFATGTVHWVCDRFFREDTPILGALLIRPFRDHHLDPEAMTRHGLLELHGNSCIPVIVALAAARLLPGEAQGVLRLGFDLWLGAFVAASMATNQFHMWAHAASVPSGVRWLQRRGLVLSPERHARHHCGEFDRSYCMTSGWLNPLLDRVDLFGRLERRIRSVSGTGR